MVYRQRFFSALWNKPRYRGWMPKNIVVSPKIKQPSDTAEDDSDTDEGDDGAKD